MAIVAIEDESKTSDVALNALNVPAPIVLATALIQAGSPLQRSKVIEIQFEYECDEIQTLVFELSIDRGANWIAYSSLEVQPTTGPTIGSVRKTVTHHNLQLRVRSATLGKLRMLAFVPHIVLEAKVKR